MPDDPGSMDIVNSLLTFDSAFPYNRQKKVCVFTQIQAMLESEVKHEPPSLPPTPEFF